MQSFALMLKVIIIGVQICLQHVVPPFIGIFLTNAAFMGAKKGRWLFPNFSFLSHNCLANSRWATSSWGKSQKYFFRFFVSPTGRVVVRAQKEIKEGEEVCTSFTKNVSRKKMRNKYVRHPSHNASKTDSLNCLFSAVQQIQVS